MTGTPINAHLLNGLSIAEAFEKYVLNDPTVASLAALVLQRDNALIRVFREGQYPGIYVEYAWPLDITSDDLAFDLVRPFAYFAGSSMPTIPKDILDVSRVLVARIRVIKDLLTSGELFARGTFARTGLITEVGRLEWARRNVAIDVQNSDLIETGGDEPVVKWSGLTLHLPVVASEERSVNLKPPTNAEGTTHGASIQAAITALWPQGIPTWITVKDRDGMINDWQRNNGQSASSNKTIQRYLAKNGA